MRLLLITILVVLAAPALGSTVTGGSITGGVMRTATPGGGGPVASCTDGVDCRCDLLIAEFGAAIAFCEDGEHPNLANTLDTRGEWHTLYNGSGAVDTCLIDNVEGLPWRVGFIGDPEAAAAGRECMHHASEANCGVPGQTDCVADGTYSIGHVMNPNKNQGITGDADFIGGRQTEFGITMLIKLSANAVVPGGSNGPAFKPNEWGDGFHPLLGFGGYAQGTPADTPNNYPFIGGLLTSSAASNATMTLGTATANQFGIYYGGSTGLYNWGSTWNVDQWACWQWHGSGLGGTAHVRMWFNETKILEGDFPTSNLLGDTSGIGKIHWNNYYNGPGNPGDGYPGATQAIRYEDNVVAFIGSEPLPCSAIGWVSP